MKQNIKRMLLVLCMAVCIFSLSACSTASNEEAEPISPEIEQTMQAGAENYLQSFVGCDDTQLEEQLKEAQKRKNTVLETGISAWISSKPDLGEIKEVRSVTVTRVDDSTYQAALEASFEKRDLTFYLTAEETINELTGATALMPTELVFEPAYTTGEKLEKAALNTLMGMGTVFLVLIFISLIIASLKNVNKIEARIKEKREEAEKAAAPAPTPVPVPAQAPALAPAQAAPAPVPVPAPVEEELPAEEEESVDDLELVAVITAAIAAASGTPVEGLVVRSIRRKSSNWKKA